MVSKPSEMLHEIGNVAPHRNGAPQMEPGAHAHGQCERVSDSQMNTEVWHPLFLRSVDRKAGQISPFLESQHVRARTVSEHPRKASSGRSEALQGARWARGSSKGSCKAQSTSLPRSLASRKANSSGCEGLCLFPYILAYKALFSATDGAMRARLWPMRP